MFEREIHTEKQRLLRLLASPEPFVRLESIAALPESEAAYKRYFWAEIQWRLYEERLVRHRHPFFDYTAPELAPLLQRVDELLVRYARFPRQELEALVDAAVKVRLNFLCRPRTTLKWFVFRGEPVKQREEVLLRLDYLSDYPYLLDGIRQQLQQMALSSEGAGMLSVLEFERIVQHADDTVLELTPSQFLALLQPLELFFRITSPHALPGHLPTAALVVFLDDKGIRFLAHELEELLRTQRLLWISHEQFLDIVACLLTELESSASDTHTLPLFPVEPAGSSSAAPSTESLESKEESQADTPAQAVEERSAAPAAEEAASHEAVRADTGEPSEPLPDAVEPHTAAEPAAQVPTAPAELSPTGAAAEDQQPLVGLLTEWLWAPPPKGVLWSDGAVAADILQAPWTQVPAHTEEPFPPFPTPLSQGSEAAPPPAEEPLADAPTAPASLLRSLQDPAWLQRYARPLLRTEAMVTELVQHLTRSPHWKAAAATLDRFFALHGIDPSTPTAQRLRSEVLRHYGIQNGGHAVR